MNKYECKHAEKRGNIISRMIWCKAINNTCAYQRYCQEQRDVEHTQNAVKCNKNK